MLDVLIKGGLLADGSGAPARLSDVGLRDGRVVVVGEPGSVSESASRTIDATGLVVMPGFVDVHTHYDAQLFWDPTASPSPLHGVTSVIGGNCGFSLAPAGEEHAEYLTRMMARVEGMPLAALQAGLDWGWRSFGDWLDRLDAGGGVGVNAGFLVGHSALRRAVMGEAAVGSVASAAQRDAMVALAHEAMTQGAFGLSTSQAHTHHDGAGDPVPSRHADRAELEALAAAVADHSGTTLELIVPGCLNGFSEDEVELLGTLSLLAGRPANWNVLGVSAMSPERTEQQLAASDAVAARGGRLVALTLPHTMKIRLSFETGAILDGLPGWREVFGMSKDARVWRHSVIRSCAANSTRAPARTRPGSSVRSPTGDVSSSSRPSPRRTPVTRAALSGRSPRRPARTRSTRCSTSSSPTGSRPGSVRRSRSPRRTGSHTPGSGATRGRSWVVPTPARTWT